MKNWPSDLALMEPGEHRHFGYSLPQWLDLHPESPLGRAWAVVYEWNRNSNSPEYVAYATIEDHLYREIKQGATDFDEMQGKILALVVAKRLEGK